MPTYSKASVPLIPLKENCRKAVILKVEFKKGQSLPHVFTNLDIIMGLVFEFMSVELVVFFFRG